jgi:hypothetical protein
MVLSVLVLYSLPLPQLAAAMAAEVLLAATVAQAVVVAIALVELVLQDKAMAVVRARLAQVVLA